jgi:hypothetical protein
MDSEECHINNIQKNEYDYKTVKSLEMRFIKMILFLKIDKGYLKSDWGIVRT